MSLSSFLGPFLSGYNTEQEAYLLTSFVLPRKPTWVLVGYNLKDYEPVVADPAWTPEEQMPKRSVKDRIKRWFKYDLITGQIVWLRIFELAKLWNPSVTSVTGSSYVQDLTDQYLLPGQGWDRVSILLKKMKNECDAANVGFTVAILPVILDFSRYPFQKVHETIIGFCERNGIYCLDLLPYFKGQKDEDFWVSIIDPHPNSRAQKIFATAVAAHLKLVLPNRIRTDTHS